MIRAGVPYHRFFQPLDASGDAIAATEVFASACYVNGVIVDAEDWSLAYVETTTPGIYIVTITPPDALDPGDDVQILVYVVVALTPIFFALGDETVDNLVAENQGGPPSQEPVARSRTAKLNRTDGGLVAESTIELSVGDGATIALDFGVDLLPAGRLSAISLVTVTSGEAGDLTIAELGVDRTLAKIRVTPAAAGSWRLAVNVTYVGGDTAIGDVLIDAA